MRNLFGLTHWIKHFGKIFVILNWQSINVFLFIFFLIEIDVINKNAHNFIYITNRIYSDFSYLSLSHSLYHSHHQLYFACYAYHVLLQRLALIFMPITNCVHIPVGTSNTVNVPTNFIIQFNWIHWNRQLGRVFRYIDLLI